MMSLGCVSFGDVFMLRSYSVLAKLHMTLLGLPLVLVRGQETHAQLSAVKCHRGGPMLPHRLKMARKTK